MYTVEISKVLVERVSVTVKIGINGTKEVLMSVNHDARLTRS